MQHMLHEVPFVFVWYPRLCGPPGSLNQPVVLSDAVAHPLNDSRQRKPMTLANLLEHS